MALVKVKDIDAFTSRRKKRQFISDKKLSENLSKKHDFSNELAMLKKRDIAQDIEHIEIILKNIGCKKVDKIINFIRKNTDI